LIEAGPRLLACFPLSQSDYVREALTRAGVEVKLNTKVTGCDARGVDTDAGRIDAATIIWAAGIVASPAARWLNVEADHVGRVKVNANLSVPGRPDIYVIGDTVTIIDAAGRQPPGTAPAAKQMGHYVAKLIADRIADPNKPTKPFRYKDVGEACHHRPPCRHPEAPRFRAQRFPRLAVLVRRPYLLPDRPAQSLHRRLHLVVELRDVPARCAADHWPRAR
jgi:NADH dehydrogenase FAD-containing subunit